MPLLKIPCVPRPHRQGGGDVVGEQQAGGNQHEAACHDQGYKEESPVEGVNIYIVLIFSVITLEYQIVMFSKSPIIS